MICYIFKNVTGYEGTCRRQGKIRHPEKFDTSFFALSHKQANVSDCRHRILLETTYESIVDAGYNPRELKGSRTGNKTVLSDLGFITICLN